MQSVIIGNKGNMGRRYEAICRWRQYPVRGIDIYEPWERQDKDTHLIMATPTEIHLGCLKHARIVWPDLPILCEKPITKDIEDLDQSLLQNVFIVDNWSHILAGRDRVTYDHYNTGKDGLLWDCIQLFMFCQQVRLKTLSPTWDVTTDKAQHDYDTQWVERRDIENSYVSMISNFVTSRLNTPAKMALPVHFWLKSLHDAISQRVGAEAGHATNVVSFDSVTRLVGLRSGELLLLDDLGISPKW